MVAISSLVLCALTLATPVASKGESSPRSAIVVGANAAALGRAALRHSHRDLEAMAEVLRTVGRFDERDVHLLRDPAPDEVIRLVEREASALAGKPQAMLFFYFSGHADRDALYSGGRPLALDRLRRALDRTDVALRIGLVEEVVDKGQGLARALAIAERVAGLSPRAVEYCKGLIHNARNGVPRRAGLSLERERFMDLFDHEDTTEGVNAFLEKRKPEWKND